MTTLQPTGVNAAQIEFWNGKAASGWVDNQDQMDRLLEPLSRIALERAAIRAGERVLDVGCGCGATSLVAARAGARVTGIDISAPMLQSARERAASERLDVQFLLADAASHVFAPEHDVLFSRFGVMFFAEPVAAFANLRTAMRSGGRVAFICWQSPRDNAWMSVPAAAIAPFLPPAPPSDPRAPGPFAFADADYLRSVLQHAGFQQIDVEGVSAQMHMGSTVDEAMLFTQKVGPLSRPLADLEGDARERALAAVRAVLAANVVDGAVQLGAKCWVATANAP